VRTFDRDGFAILAGVFDRAQIEALIVATSKTDADRGVRSRGGVYAIRNLVPLSPPIRDLAQSPKLRAIVEAHLGDGVFPVRATLFDKIAGANWLVPPHQDLTICVTARIEVPGYGPWTRKAGVWHVQPPVRVLDRMVSVGIHLDDCGEVNGALRVVPGTDKLGASPPRRSPKRKVRGAPWCA